MKKNIEILVVEPGELPVRAVIPNTIEAMEEILGGVSQIGCFLPQKVLLLSRRQANSLPPNRQLPDGKGVVRGIFLLCGVPEKGCCMDSLTEEQLKDFQTVFEQPGEFLSVGDHFFTDPDDVADAVYGLWDTMKDGESIVLKKWGSHGGISEV